MANSSNRPVVITRPQAQAEPLAQKFSALGRKAVVFPLLDILPLPDQSALKAALADVGSYAMVAFVSPNAIDAAFAHIDRWPSHVALAVVGEGSKTALARHGLTPANATIYCPVDPHRTDSQTLLEALDLDALRGKRAMILRGETGRELLADALRDHGVLVDQVAAYRRAGPVLDDAKTAILLRLLDEGADWVITSSEALRYLLQMVRDAAGESGVVKMQQQRLVVPHVRIAETAHSLGFNDVLQTASGDEPLLAALQFQA
ncbi:uroporphyrinogen-III synthase [Noviherbaspirillum denitrificans]|uniref:Uroporphyrinogen-III synthase n=1 Tax=Noviherbaspirillum denitrificans TaxID=1968433 RepID=A0A254TN16_9BURK|nr:uroporphyrinogen-III synthase [Noviherbaspirillum denitrificans]OWW22013.1 uroporphyrinogen III synthase [Noviherbaspirillum denitrificans]